MRRLVVGAMALAAALAPALGLVTGLAPAFELVAGLTPALGLVAGLTPAMADEARGKALFGADCGLCHQGQGQGVPGQFPRLAGRIAAIAAKPEGRVYLTHVLASGMTGAVKVDGATIVGYMPPFGTLPAADVADILTYVTTLGGGAAVAFSAADVQAGRAAKLAPSAVHEERVKLVAAKVVPE